MPYREFARRINCERQTLYHLFKCRSIDVERLMLISRVLGYDFLRNVYMRENAAGADDRRTLVIRLSREQVAGCDRIVVEIRDKGDAGVSE